jgi:acyl-lipid (7-3)-desaturase (Delta-4 desaturase)
MAPDAEKVRQRRVVTNKGQASLTNANNNNHVNIIDAYSDPSISTTPATKSIPRSQLGKLEMCIDGIVYDISEFQYSHPGGNTFLTFGGNDVTVQYKMIHPYHTTKHLQKMKVVGIVPDYHTELRI